MKYYLSSYGFGEKTKKLKEILPDNKKVAYIPNAKDAYSLGIPENKERFNETLQRHIDFFKELGCQLEVLDLKEYFGKENELKSKVKEFGIFWVPGGNTFVLRQAMHLSGFDNIFKELSKKENLLYGGYSAGICILAKSMKGLDIVDHPEIKPYGNYPTIWEGLDITKEIIIPHYKSEHPESEDVDKTVEYMKDHNIPFKTLKDGQVIII